MILTLEEKIGQMLGVGFTGLEPPEYLLRWLAEGRVGAVILFARNVDTPEQVAALMQRLHEASKHPLLICIDQEGGLVARLRDGFSESPGAMALGAGDSEAMAYEVSRVLGVELRALGINWNLAPAVDVTHSIENPSIGTRSLGSDAARVARLAAAEVRGFQSAGIAATAKHFPGIGNTPVDTHLASAVIRGPLDYLWAHDLVPFRAAVEAGADCVMVGHVTLEDLDPHHPATLSPRVIGGLLRGDIGFDGLACTDCMEMQAVTDHFGPGESAVLAALAGQDMILFSHTPARQEAAYHALLDAARSGQLSADRIDSAVERVQAVKRRVAIDGPPALDRIRTPEHLRVMRDAARAGIVVVREDATVLPLPQPTPEGTLLVEFTSYLDTQAIDLRGLSTLAALLRAEAPGIEVVALAPDGFTDEDAEAALERATHASLLIVATRNAHLLPRQADLAQRLLHAGPPTLLLCLRNPYDAGLLAGARAILCACGDSTPSLAACVEALLGRFRPSGRLPVPLPEGTAS